LELPNSAAAAAAAEPAAAVAQVTNLIRSYNGFATTAWVKTVPAAPPAAFYEPFRSSFDIGDLPPVADGRHETTLLGVYDETDIAQKHNSVL
jgi:hypothetical protein